MSEALNEETRVWSARIAQAYADAATPMVAGYDKAWLSKVLEEPLSDCVFLAIPPEDWPQHFVNPTLTKWERAAGRQLGPRLARVDYANGSVTMGR